MFAALYIPDLSVEAIVRSAPELRYCAVAVVQGTPPMEMVCALNEAARALGIEAGMTRLQAQERDPKLEVRRRSPAQEQAAHAALLDCAQAFSPRVEDTAPDTALADLAGLDQLFGSPAKIARDLAKRASDMGLEAHVAVASNPDAAMHAARGFSGVTVIPRGKESERLGTLSVETLSPAPELLDTLERWGIRNLRALAVLPEVAVTERLGQEGLRLQRLARGTTARDLVPCQPPLHFEESLELEHPVELLEPLAFVLSRLLEQLCTRLNARALATNELRLALELDTIPDIDSDSPQRHRATEKKEENDPSVSPCLRGGCFFRTLKLPVPMLDSKLFLKLLQLDLRSHPPSAPVKKVTLTAEPVRPRFAQGGLFLPTAPEPERLELTLARIAGTVGEGNVGSAELLDTHRPDAFRMVKFLIAPGLKPFFEKEADTQRLQPLGVPGVLALRLFRPPLPIRVDVRSGRPTHVRSDRINGEVVSAAGPWKVFGEWWKTKSNHRDTENTEKNDSWGREEWDIAVACPTAKTDAVGLYRIYADEHGRWFAHGEYD
jgi:protein ImuB